MQKEERVMMYPVEYPENLDKVRAEFDLCPIEEYVALLADSLGIDPSDIEL